MFKSIMVLESPWDAELINSKSVWPFVSGFAKVIDIQAYHQIFSDKASFVHWIRQFDKEDLPNPKLLYIAGHGYAGRISGLRGNINSNTIITTLKGAKNIHFVHFGSCFFGNESNLHALLKAAKHIIWAAGYEQNVDWVDSTIFDIMLWGRIINRSDIAKGVKFHSITRKLLAETPGLTQNLGFRMQYRYGKTINSIFSSDSE